MVRLLEHAADANYTPCGLEGLPLYIAIRCLAVVNLLFEWTDFNKLLTCDYSRGSLLCIAAVCGSEIHILQLWEDGFKIKDPPDMHYSWKRESLLFNTVYGGPGMLDFVLANGLMRMFIISGGWRMCSWRDNAR